MDARQAKDGTFETPLLIHVTFSDIRKRFPSSIFSG